MRAFAIGKLLERGEKCPTALVFVHGGIEVEVHVCLSLADGCAEAIFLLHEFFPNAEKPPYIEGLFGLAARIHAFVLLSR